MEQLWRLECRMLSQFRKSCWHHREGSVCSWSHNWLLSVVWSFPLGTTPKRIIPRSRRESRLLLELFHSLNCSLRCFSLMHFQVVIIMASINHIYTMNKTCYRVILLLTNNSRMYLLWLFIFYRRRNWGSGRLGNLPKVTASEGAI